LIFVSIFVLHLANSFAALLVSLRDPAYLEAFVLERNGVRMLATMSAHIVEEATSRAAQARIEAKRLKAEANSSGGEHEIKSDGRGESSEHTEAPPVAQLTVCDKELKLSRYRILYHRNLCATAGNI
jgi:hypothetical protein